MIQQLYTIGKLQQLRETHVDIPTFHFHNLSARISQYYCCGWNACEVELASYVRVVKPYIKHTRKQFIKTPVQVPMQKKHKQETKTMSERSEELAKQNKRVKKFLGQPQNKPSNPKLLTY